MIRNKLQVFLLKPQNIIKQVGEKKLPTKIVSGPKLDHCKMRYRIDNVKYGLLSYKAKSMDHAQKLLNKMDLKNIREAFYYDNQGVKFPLINVTNE